MSQPSSAPDRSRVRILVPAFTVGFFGMLGAGLAWGLLDSLMAVSTVLTYIGIALFVAMGVEPIITWLGRHRITRGWAVLIIIVAGAILVTGILLVLVPLIVGQVQDFVRDLPGIIEELLSTGWVSALEAQLAGVVDINALLGSMTTWMSYPTNVMSLGGGVVAVGTGIAGFVSGLIIVSILTMYFTATLPAILRGFHSLVPASKRELTQDVTEEITRSVGRYILGQGCLAAINGVCSAIFLSVIGAPLAALLAFIAFLGSLVPLVGTLTGSIIITISCLVADPRLALIAGIYYLVYMQIEAYVFSPRIMNKAVNIPGALVIIAAVTGGALGGVLGAIVAVPVAASCLIVIRKVVIPRQNRT